MTVSKWIVLYPSATFHVNQWNARVSTNPRARPNAGNLDSALRADTACADAIFQNSEIYITFWWATTAHAVAVPVAEPLVRGSRYITMMGQVANH